LKVADDYYNAALILQHGSTAEDYELAHQLAKRAVELKSDHAGARWLAGAAKDRSLWAQNKPRIYGTQFQKFTADGPNTMEPFDRDAVTDEERQEAGVRTLAESERRLEDMNKAPLSTLSEPSASVTTRRQSSAIRVLAAMPGAASFAVRPVLTC
jgi:hypothetical protein